MVMRELWSHQHKSCWWSLINVLIFLYQKLREGIYKDLERQERKRQNRMELEQQIALTKRLTEERDRRENHSH